MIRIILFSIAFVAVTAALIIFQPGATQIRERMDAEYDVATVTRAATAPDALPRALVQPVTRSEPAPAADVTATLSALVRKSQAPVAEPPKVEANPALAIAAAVQASRGAGGDELARTTSALLSELGKAPVAGAEDDALMAMTQSVLASLTGVGGAADTPTPGDLQTLVVQALRQGQSDAYLDALLNEARDSGQVVVPDALITSDGKVDTATLLATLVQRSVNAGPVPADSGLARTAVEVTTRPKARAVTETQVYTVKPGDSLAAISYRFYGDTLQYTAIYEANRDKITTPDKIRVGQTLTIPVL
ncbi:LysM peptidoglycan-binding domain-containing protein [Mameliella alba]|nr:LysM peptidoglycan-binding domain-containing protein [Antarctobacter heliothermus]MBY6142426.1 LysM peptidoglycan-binding domain-containing protein [Mameliella alba]MCA0953849.1 LysM peptidoglycan-binding domain-containing protein [Mameliella alba]